MMYKCVKLPDSCPDCWTEQIHISLDESEIVDVQKQLQPEFVLEKGKPDGYKLFEILSSFKNVKFLDLGLNDIPVTTKQE